jgi:hypothetical protein
MMTMMMMQYALQEYPAPEGGGHLIVADDSLINHCQIKYFNTSKVRTPARYSVRSHMLG